MRQRLISLGAGYPLATEPPVDETCAKRELIRRLDEQISTLPADERVVMELRYRSGNDCCSFAEVADELGLSRQGAQYRHARAIRRLRARLGLDADEFIAERFIG